MTNQNTTHCLLDGLKHNTEYLVDLESIAGGETSESVFMIVQTNRFCPGLQEPQNGAIIDSQSTNGMEMATLECEFGYELTVVDMKNPITSKVCNVYNFFIIINIISQNFLLYADLQ